MRGRGFEPAAAEGVFGQEEGEGLRVEGAKGGDGVEDEGAERPVLLGEERNAGGKEWKLRVGLVIVEVDEEYAFGLEAMGGVGECAGLFGGEWEKV